jgi:hypothetical protein
MKRALTIVVVALLANLAQSAASLTAAPLATATAAGTVKVTVHYKGKGTVDASHKLWVWVFDTPNIGPGAMPLDQVALDKNDLEAVFNNVVADKVWIAVAYDESGSMKGDAPPPSGTPIGILAGSDGVPAPVMSGAKGAAVVTFDDSQRMP